MGIILIILALPAVIYLPIRKYLNENVEWAKEDIDTLDAIVTVNVDSGNYLKFL